MDVQKWFTAAAVTLSIAAMAALLLPIYSTVFTDGEACTVVVRGYNLVEFSPWGGVVLLTPVVLIGVLLSEMRPHIQTIGMLVLLLLDGAALCGATWAAHSWITDITAGYVEPHMGHLFYALLLFGAAVCAWVSVLLMMRHRQAN